MIIKRLALIAFMSFVLTACANDNNNDGGNDSLDELNPDNNNQNAPQSQTTETEEDYKLGYVRYKKDQIDIDEENKRMININRNKMADIISRTILSSNGFNEVATLVTNDKVLVAYDKDEEDKRGTHESADIAKQTAFSILPRFYDVYVSDNETLMDDIHSLHNSKTTENDYDNTIQSIIKKMKESSQGIDKD